MKHVCHTRAWIVTFAVMPMGLSYAATTPTATPAAAAAPAARSAPAAPAAPARTPAAQPSHPQPQPTNSSTNTQTTPGQQQTQQQTQQPTQQPTQQQTQQLQQNANETNHVEDPQHHRRDDHVRYLVPGFYGSNYWDSGWYNNQGYGGFNQYDRNNSNYNQQPVQNVQPADEPRAPALIEPAGQADAPSLTAALRASPAYQEAEVELRAAQSEFDAASQRVGDRLKQNPSYRQAQERKDADASKLTTLKAVDPNASPEQSAAIAQSKLDAAKSVSDMQREAIAADPQAAAAKAKLDAAIAKRAAIRAQIVASMPKTAAH